MSIRQDTEGTPNSYRPLEHTTVILHCGAMVTCAIWQRRRLEKYHHVPKAGHAQNALDPAQVEMSPSCALVYHVWKVRYECFIDTSAQDVMKRSAAPGLLSTVPQLSTSFQGYSECSRAVKSCNTLQSASRLQRRHPLGVTSSKVSTDLYLKLATEVQPISC
jgi:hypothetical protein